MSDLDIVMSAVARNGRQTLRTTAGDIQVTARIGQQL